MKGLSQKTILVSGAVVIAVVIIAGILIIQSGFGQEQPDQYQVPSPEQVVRQYFTSWNNNDWSNMYAAISDGFKRLDPNANYLATFRSYASSQAIDGVRILSIRETSNNGIAASVDYSVEFLINRTARPFSGTFTLRYRPGDVIRGWKLVHPYGPNVDTS